MAVGQQHGSVFILSKPVSCKPCLCSKPVKPALIPKPCNYSSAILIMRWQISKLCLRHRQRNQRVLMYQAGRIAKMPHEDDEK